ncbi:MAG: hypothetical protein ACF8MJ_04785 [Phycisphaerales bacterium JB050]
MDFLAYVKALPAIEQLGVKADEHDGVVRFTIADDRRVTLSIGAKPPSDHPADRTLEAPAELLPRLCDEVFHALNINEVALVPFTMWREVLDLTAFDMAMVERWLDIDAEASLHQNSRDPLFVSRDEHETLETMVRSLLTNAEKIEQSIAVLASGGTALVVDVLPPDRLFVQCVGQGVADRVMEYLRKVK